MNIVKSEIYIGVMSFKIVKGGKSGERGMIRNPGRRTRTLNRVLHSEALSRILSRLRRICTLALNTPPSGVAISPSPIIPIMAPEKLLSSGTLNFHDLQWL